MTTIAYRDGIMAADSRAYAGDRRPIGFKQKIRRLANGGLFAATSKNPGMTDRLYRWVEEFGVEKDHPEELDVGALVIMPGGAVWYYAGHRSFTGPLTADFFTIGSGEDYAVAAMSMGATAIEAVKIAMQHDVFTAGPIQVEALDAPDR